MFSKNLAALCTVTAVLGTAVSATQAAANPAHASYLVTVVTSFGTKFADCFSFDGAGNLTVGGYGTLTYGQGAKGADKGSFSSVSPIAVAESVGFAITFAGYAFGPASSGYLKAIGNDEQGDTYSLRGATVSSCTASAATRASYRPAAQ